MGRTIDPERMGTEHLGSEELGSEDLGSEQLGSEAWGGERIGTSWMARGNCVHESPSLFFPSDGVGVEIARKVCATCPVKDSCLEYALVNRIDHGVWGGSSERERRRILRRRRLEAIARA